MIASGVPQGTALGPVLFLAIIADINQDVTHSSVFSFADDTRLNKSVKCPTDCDNLQKDLHVVYEWATENNKKFNIEKFQYVCYHTKHSVNIDNIYLSPFNHIINPVESLRYLGVIMSNSCSFNAHIAKTVLSCSRLISWILRTFSKRDKCTMLTFFKAVVRPILEYACQLWSPGTVNLITKLEKMQRSFTKYFFNMHELTYDNRLKDLNLYSIQRRRERYQIIYVWKILEEKVTNFNPQIVPNSSGRLGRLCIKTCYF